MGDYIAIIRIGGGSSHGRAYTKEAAVKNALLFLSDWESIFDIPEQDIQIPVYDVEGYGYINWDNRGLHGVPAGCETGCEKIEDINREPEMITAHYKPKKRKRRA